MDDYHTRQSEREAEMPEALKDETAWLIEFKPQGLGAQWLDKKFNLTRDSLQAMRFARKEDAEAMVNLIFSKASESAAATAISSRFKLGHRSLWKATEHMWIAIEAHGESGK